MRGSVMGGVPARGVAAGLACLAALPAVAEAPPLRGADPAGTFAFLLENDTFSGNDRY
jgi:hypothetical protein